MSVMMGSVLKLESLAFSYPNRQLFEDLNYEASCAALCCGNNGTGKTTLLRVVAGLLPPIKGTMTLNGKTTWRTSTFFDVSVLMAKETVASHLKWMRPLTDETLDAEELGISGDVPVRLLSAGKRRLLALRLASAMPADMLVADEPFAHLDGQACQLVNRWFERAIALGRFVMLSSPVLPSLTFHADIWNL